MYGFYACAIEPRNPGHAGVGIVIADEDGKVVHSHGEYLGNPISVWLAEFKGLLVLVRKAVELNVEDLKIFGTNQQIIRQMSGQMSIGDPKQYEVAQEIVMEMSLLDKVAMKKIERAKSPLCVELAENAVRRYSKDRPNPYFSVTVGGVQFRRVDKYTYRVLGGDTYYVNARTRECTCPAYQFRPGFPCKHVRAILDYEKKAR